jgi:DNA-directed RNA polymerase subunit E'/Rpb7
MYFNNKNYKNHMIVIIERRICLESQFLDSNLIIHLLEKIRSLTEDECTKEFGHILSVIRIIKIKDNIISSSNSDNVFTLVFEAEILKPEIGSIFDGQVCMILSSGIFLDVQNKLKILIPHDQTGLYTLNINGMYYSKGEDTIKQGDTISVLITGIKYTSQNFSCFGSLVSE